MSTLPPVVRDAWKERTGAAVFATSDCDGNPNAVYITCVEPYGEDQFVIADNFFDKTRKNIDDRATGVLLFICRDGKAYQLKGSLRYEKEGPAFSFMKSWNAQQLPGHAAVVLSVEHVYHGAEKLL